MPKYDEFSIRMKEYEARETSRKLLPYVPVYARIDGRSFSRFTAKAIKPFDPTITGGMIAAAKALVEQTNALMAYVQSDEISLAWETTEPGEALIFDGKIQKMTSVLAGIATAAFIRELANDAMWNITHPEWLNKLPHFDARVIQMPNRTEVANMFLWREADARKNAITMIASSLYSHKELHGKSGREKIEMIDAKGDQPFKTYPAALRRGVFMKRVTETYPISDEARMAIPEHARPAEGSMITRSSIKTLEMPSFNKVRNREDVIFEGANPIVAP